MDPNKQNRELFWLVCFIANIQPTKRQWKKFIKHRGLAFKTLVLIKENEVPSPPCNVLMA